METIIRNLLSVIRKFKAATFFNVLGLSISFAIFMVILMQLTYDWYFDRHDKHSDNIFRVEVVIGGTPQAIINRPLAEAFRQSSPHILFGSLSRPPRNISFSAYVKDSRHDFDEKIVKVQPDYVNVFDFTMIEGEEKALEEPEKVLIPQSLSVRVFGNEPAIGRSLTTDDKTYTIGGVYKDFPKNSSVKNAVFSPITEDENVSNWGAWMYSFYVRLDRPENSETLFDHFKTNFDTSVIGPNFSWENTGSSIRLTQLRETHFSKGVLYDDHARSDRFILIVLLTIGISILIIAAINFTNFSVALAPLRVRSINTQKILGGSVSTIRLSLVVETLCISLFSFLVALVLVYFIQYTRIESLIEADITLTNQLPVIMSTLMVSIFIGVISGIYPSYYMTSFQPALVLKGSFALSPKGRSLRNALIGIQFAAALSLIIVISFMYLQNNYMKNSYLGYDKDEIIVVNMSEALAKSRNTLTDQLKLFSGIEEVSYGEHLLSSADQYTGLRRDFRGEQIRFQCLPVDYTFLQTMGIHIAEGRDFREGDEQTQEGVYIFNHKAQKEYGLELGDKIDQVEIVGFTSDVKFASFRTEVVPMAFYVGKSSYMEYAYIRLSQNASIVPVVSHIKSEIKAIDPAHKYDVLFFDNILDQLYKKESNINLLITLFCLMAILISIVGVFGLVVFECEYRRKEIGIRKVLGSTIREILILFNKTYLRILCFCFLFAAPIAHLIIDKWLQNFAYKTPVYWWVYLLAFLLLTLITMGTVSFQSWQVANLNPVKSLKTE